MSMVHKAYAFDWDAFDAALRPVLVRALETDDPSGLAAFIEANRTALTDVRTMKPLAPGWRAAADLGDVQALGALALTRYYDPLADDGLLHGWLPHVERLPPAVRRALLGTPLVAGGRAFNPGRVGSWFQPPDQVRESARVLRQSDLDVGEEAEDYARYAGLLARCVASGSGLYVTF